MSTGKMLFLERQSYTSASLHRHSAIETHTRPSKLTPAALNGDSKKGGKLNAAEAKEIQVYNTRTLLEEPRSSPSEGKTLFSR